MKMNMKTKTCNDAPDPYKALLALAKRHKIAMDNRNHTELRNVHLAVDKMLVVEVNDKHRSYTIQGDRFDQVIKLSPVVKKRDLINLHFSYDLTPTKTIKLSTKQSDVDLIVDLLNAREWSY